MLKALKRWRDQPSGPSPEDDPRERALRQLRALERRRPRHLADATSSKRDFLDALESMIEAGVSAERLGEHVEIYFRRHGGPDLLVEWGWDSAPAASGVAGPDESMRSQIARGMAEAGEKLALAVLGGRVPDAGGSSPLSERIALAEWSIRRGDQTILSEESRENITLWAPSARGAA
jgi:hypothetical protein